MSTSELIEFMKSCRQLGVQSLTLPDGTAFTLFPSYDVVASPLQEAGQAGTLPKSPASEEPQSHDELLEELDRELGLTFPK